MAPNPGAACPGGGGTGLAGLRSRRKNHVTPKHPLFFEVKTALSDQQDGTVANKDESHREQIGIDDDACSTRCCFPAQVEGGCLGVTKPFGFGSKPLKRRDSRKGIIWIPLPLAWVSLPLAWVSFPLAWIGFRRAWIGVAATASSIPNGSHPPARRVVLPAAQAVDLLLKLGFPSLQPCQGRHRPSRGSLTKARQSISL